MRFSIGFHPQFFRYCSFIDTSNMEKSSSRSTKFKSLAPQPRMSNSRACGGGGGVRAGPSPSFLGPWCRVLAGHDKIVSTLHTLSKSLSEFAKRMIISGSLSMFLSSWKCTWVQRGLLSVTRRAMTKVNCKSVPWCGKSEKSFVPRGSRLTNNYLHGELYK